jgi:hypothetical protein
MIWFGYQCCFAVRKVINRKYSVSWAISVLLTVIMSEELAAKNIRDEIL